LKIKRAKKQSLLYFFGKLFFLLLIFKAELARTIADNPGSVTFLREIAKKQSLLYFFGKLFFLLLIFKADFYQDHRR